MTSFRFAHAPVRDSLLDSKFLEQNPEYCSFGLANVVVGLGCISTMTESGNIYIKPGFDPDTLMTVSKVPAGFIEYTFSNVSGHRRISLKD